MNDDEQQWSDEGLKRLLGSVKRYAYLQDLSDEELAKLAVEKVWAELPAGSEEADIVNEMIDRIFLFDESEDYDCYCLECQRPIKDNDDAMICIDCGGRNILL